MRTLLTSPLGRLDRGGAMSPLDPSPPELDLESPALGPWFDNATVTLAVPNPNLSVSVTATTGLVAFPPATGFLSYYVATAAPPNGLRRLRQADGSAAFTTGNLVALFTLSPEVEQRLMVLSMGVAPATGGAATAGVPTRPTVRHLAYEFTADDAAMMLLEAVAAPPIRDTTDATSNADRATHLGLAVADDGSTLVNGTHPMTDLLVTGQWFNERQAMLNIGDRAFTLWAFDDNGRAIDPGAVASWWNHLNTLFSNLWAPGPEDMQRTVTFAPRLTVHLVNPSEGPLDPTLQARVTAGSTPVTTALVTSGTTGTALAFSAAPSGSEARDDAPVPAMAVLPSGTYGARTQITQTAVTLFPNGAVHADLTRDYVRVGVVDVERHLVGQARTPPDGASGDVLRRAEDQSRTETRVAVNRVAGANLVMHTTLDAIAGPMLAGFGTNPTTLVMPTLDREYGPLAVPALPAATPPTAPPTITAQALVGGGVESVHGRIDGQVVLLQVAVTGFTAAGAWVRVWPHGFDADTGRHVALDGGAGVVLAGGAANVIVTLPDGVFEGRDLLADSGCDIAVTTGSGNVTFADVRFTRPTPVGGLAIGVDDAAQLFACEVGPITEVAALPPGCTLFSDEGGGSFALVDRSTVAAGAFAGTIDAAITADDTIILTQPAWVQSEPGDVPLRADDETTGDLPTGTVVRAERSGLDAPFAPGVPHPTMEFFESAATSASTTSAATATIGAAAGLRHHHELPPHQLGHPGAPAAREAGGVGVTMNGAAALVAAEFTRDRSNPATFHPDEPDLVTAATPAPPTITPPTAPTPWLAVLRTIGFGVDGEPFLSEAIRGVASAFPGFDDVLSVVSFLEGVVNALPGTFDVTGDVPRAVSRRMLSSGWGLREVATSLDAAFARAEDIVYIETPAIDTLAMGADGDVVIPVRTLVDRVRVRPWLHVVLCLPRRSPPGWPAKLGRVRDALAQQTIAALEAEGPGRIGVFHPASGRDRALDLSSTAVVVDDNYGLVGTSHLWRRGLSFDGGLAASVFDERLTMGRPTVVRAFRLALVGQRLGAAAGNVPLDPAELVGLIRDLAASAGAGRVTTRPISTPDPAPNTFDNDLWNRDGSALDGFNPFTWFTNAAVQSEFSDEVP